MNMPVKSLSRDGKVIETARLTKLLAFRGLDRRPIEEAEAGDIIAIAGFAETTVADTICAPEVETALPSSPVDPPTLAMSFVVNDSPLAGREGTKVTSRMIVERLEREAEGNVAIRIQESEQRDAVEVAGRGELQLGVLIETMRREGFELAISRPRVLFKTDPATGERLEPIEEVVIDLDEPFAGIVVEEMSLRKGEMQEMRPTGGGKLRLVFLAPTRGLIGYLGKFLTDTRGTGVMSRIYHGYASWRGAVEGRRNGVLVSTASGEAVTYALWNLEERGPMFITPGTPVYAGMIIGAHTRGNDLDVNPCKTKQLTNIRTKAADEAIRLTPPILMSLEQAIAYIADDELCEVTPKSIRLRKRYLDPNERKRESRKVEAAG
jgi:GTP-binding protein